MVAAVVGKLVPGHVMVLGGASVAAMTSLVGQAAHCNEGESAATAELNLSAWVSLILLVLFHNLNEAKLRHTLCLGHSSVLSEVEGACRSLTINNQKL